MVYRTRLERIASFACSTFLIIAAFSYSSHSSAYQLSDTDTCKPGARWSTSAPVKVKLLSLSLTDYVQRHLKQIDNGLLALSQAIADIQSVVDEYNAVNGSTLKLEYAGPILDDSDLGDYDEDQFGSHTIVVGFTDDPPPSNSVPAWTPEYSGDKCTYDRRHIRFSKKDLWTFGLPEYTVADGKHFGIGTSFRAVLLHEMGHAVGLQHALAEYAVMDHGTKAWTRGKDEVPTMQLLPDDSTALRILYPVPGGFAVKPDISLTNTWFLSAADRTHYNTVNNKAHKDCQSAENSLDQLKQSREQQVTVMKELSGHPLEAATDRLNQIDAEIASATQTLNDCYYREDEAGQIPNCQVSTAGDTVSNPGDGDAVFSGVISKPDPKTKPIGNVAYPGDLVQLRYTVNNKTPYKVKLNEEIYFSIDERLDISGSQADLRSPDQYESELVDTWTSKSLDRTVRVPSTAKPGECYYVFARVIASDAHSGETVFDAEQDHWNNSIRLPGILQIATSVCPRG